MCNHGVVSPRSVVVGEHDLEVKMLGEDARFLVRLAGGSSDGVFVRVERAARQRPSSSAVRPCGPELQQHAHIGQIVVDEQKSSCTVESPMGVTARAVHPSVAVTMSHVVIVFGRVSIQ